VGNRVNSFGNIDVRRSNQTLVSLGRIEGTGKRRDKILLTTRGAMIQSKQHFMNHHPVLPMLFTLIDNE
jgi:hypothetical protein